MSEAEAAKLMSWSVTALYFVPGAVLGAPCRLVDHSACERRSGMAIQRL